MTTEDAALAAFREIPRRKRLRILFWEFFKIACYVVGGGFAILVAAEDIFVRKYRWMRENELSDMLALIQTVPGLTAGNIAIYAGNRIAGTLGALAALAGVATPSFLIITLVAFGFHALPMAHPLVQGAFLGVRTAMTALTLVAALRILRGSLRDGFQGAVVLLAMALVMLFHVNPGWIIGGGLLLGPVWCFGVLRRLPPAAEEDEP